MRNTYSRQTLILFMVLFIFMTLGWDIDSSAAVRVVESVETSANRITFHFSVPMQYQIHSPAQNGKDLQIELRSLTSIQDINDFTKSYSLNWSKIPDDPIMDITYEGFESGNIRLSLKFNQTINFDLIRSSGPYELNIDISQNAVVSKGEPEKSGPRDSLVEQDSLNRFAINLRSSLKPFDAESYAALPELNKYHLYTTEFSKNGQNWHRLRIGFFSTEKEAKDIYETLKNDFPEAWVTKASASDHDAPEIRVLSSAPSQQQPAEPVHPALHSSLLPVEAVNSQAVTAKSVSPTEQKEQQLLKEAEKTMIDKDYHRAVQFYTKLTQSTNQSVQQQAQELLGLARERNGQMAHAKAEYEKYLNLYPEGEGAERVKQRLAGLLTARSTPRERLRKAKETTPDDSWNTETYGSFSQFYDRDVTYTQADETVINRSSISSDLDFNARIRNDDFDIRTTFIGGLENDFEKDSNDLHISSLYIDALAKRLNLSTRIGRQSRSSGGVLGRFDGGLLSWRMNDSTAVNLVAGFPVASSTDTDLDTDRPLYGISLDLGTYAQSWDFNAFFISQNVEGITDRQAIGGEVRYFHRSLSFFSLIDYDISYNDLNTVLLTANYTLPSKTSLSMSFDYRNSPILTTSNALQGQSATSIDGLLNTFSEDEIRQLARDRTATSRSYTLGITHPFNQHFQISSDLTISDYSSTPASGGVEAQPGTGNEYFYSMQFVGSSLIREGDIAILGFRYADTNQSYTYSASINSRYPLTRELRINPRAVIDYRTNKDDDGKQWKVRPLLRLEYIWKKRFHLEFEGGGEWSSKQLAGQDDDTKGYFFTVGYRIDF